MGGIFRYLEEKNYRMVGQEADRIAGEKVQELIAVAVVATVLQTCGDGKDGGGTPLKSGHLDAELQEIEGKKPLLEYNLQFFANKDGELPIEDVPVKNRILLENVANNAENIRGIDIYGTTWYTKALENGKEAWAQVRDGKIFDGGINEMPKPWNTKTGLKNRKKGTKMKTMQSFLIFYYILDQGYYKSEKYYKYEVNGIRYGELSCFLSAISPEIWGDGQPTDKSVLDEWEKFSNPKEVSINNIMEKVYTFLDYYGEKFDYDFSGIKQCLLTTADEITIQKAYDKSQLMYQEFQYPN